VVSEVVVVVVATTLVVVVVLDVVWWRLTAKTARKAKKINSDIAARLTD
jgi:hypothetical protein